MSRDGQTPTPATPLPLPGGFEAPETVLWKSSVRGKTPGGVLSHSFNIAPLPYVASPAHLHPHPGVPPSCSLTTPHPKQLIQHPAGGEPGESAGPPCKPIKQSGVSPELEAGRSPDASGLPSSCFLPDELFMSTARQQINNAEGETLAGPSF